MSRIDLHVDELLDQARRGALSASDHARLTAHCEMCVACRMEFAWLTDGVHRAAPSAEDRALAASAVEALLGGVPEQHGVAAGAQRQAAAPGPASRPVRRSTSGRRVAALACAWLLSTSAAAALYTEVRAWRARAVEVEVQTRASAAASTEHAARPRRGHKARPASTVPAQPAAEPVEEAAPSAVEELAASEPIADPNPNPNPRSVSVSVSVSGSASASASASVSGSSVAEQRAELLFARANAARATGSHEQALADYAQLARLYPRTRSAQASRISRADLLRRIDQPAQALAAYQSYLATRPNGALAEEARAGVAASYQRLGREEQERAAWQELLDHHPGSLHAARARARLLALSR